MSDPLKEWIEESLPESNVEQGLCKRLRAADGTIQLNLTVTMPHGYHHAAVQVYEDLLRFYAATPTAEAVLYDQLRMLFDTWAKHLVQLTMNDLRTRWEA